MTFYHRKLMNLLDPKGVDNKLPKGPKPKSLAPPLTHHHYLIAIIALTSFLVALLFLCVSIYFVLRSRKNRIPAQPDDENLVFAENDLFVVDRIQGPTEEEEEDHHVWHIRTVGLPESVISSIAEFKYEKRGEGSILDCPVCLSEFEEDERVKLLPECVHAFHSECIDSWLRSHKNCPVCRAPVVIVVGSSGEGRKLRVVSDLGDYGRVRNVMIRHDQEFVNKVRRSNSMS